MNLKDVSSEDLIKELQRRNDLNVRCPTCKKYTVTYKYYAGRGKHWHCDGCNRWVEHCKCGRI